MLCWLDSPSLIHILVYTECRDLQSIHHDIYTMLFYSVLNILHSSHKGWGSKDQLFLELL